MTIFHSIKWPINTDSGFIDRDIIRDMHHDIDGVRILAKWRDTQVPEGMSTSEQLADIIATWDNDNISHDKVAD